MLVHCPTFFFSVSGDVAVGEGGTGVRARKMLADGFIRPLLARGTLTSVVYVLDVVPRT